jgi:hypothetical protein
MNHDNIKLIVGFGFINSGTVKPVFRGRLRDIEKVALYDRCHL